MIPLRRAEVPAPGEPVPVAAFVPVLVEASANDSVVAEAQAPAEVSPYEPVSGVRPLSPPEAIDAQVVAHAQAGARWALEEIFRRHGPYVAGMVLRLLRSRTDAEDVVQDVFLRALERLQTLRDGGALRGWLARIAINLVRRRFRRRRLLRFLGLDRAAEDATWDALATQGASGEDRAELAALDRVLVTLPIKERIAWVLRHVEDMSIEEVAHACSCSPATAKRRIAAAQSRVSLHVTLNGGGS